MDKIEKEKLIKKELTKLNSIFKNLPKDKQRLSEGLKNQACFVLATLAELQEMINNDGAVDLFEQGKQKMFREHPASKTYNSMVRNYLAICKQLLDLLPSNDGSQKAADELMGFLRSRK
jgi:hypothetical protein